MGFIGSGNLYMFGKCKDDSSNIYINLNPKIRSVELNEFMDLVKFVFLLVRNNACIPGYLERFNIILILSENQSSKSFVIHLLDRLRYILVRTYPFCVNRFIFVGNLGDLSDKFLEFKRKMNQFFEVLNISDSEMDILGDIIANDQLEQKFGGGKPNLVEYWPPIHHTPPQESIDDEDLGKLRIIPFYIYDEDYDNFKKNFIPGDVKIEGRQRQAGLNFKSRLVFIGRGWKRGSYRS